MRAFPTDEVQAAINDASHVVRGVFLNAALIGSCYITGEGNDLDILLMVQDAGDAMVALDAAGYKATGNPSGEDDEFLTLRKGDVNLIVTETQEFFDAFLSAAEVCKALGLSKKWQRIAVHRVLMNDEDADTAKRKALEVAGEA